MTAATRIQQLVKAALPKGAPFRIIWEPTGMGKWRILRVVTPAWKSLPRSARILKVQQAVEPNLTAQERSRIFRFSVLTPAELRRLQTMLPEPSFSTARRNKANGGS
jgi:hypothetical protein